MTPRRTEFRIPVVGRSITPLGEEFAAVEAVDVLGLLSAETTTSLRRALRFLDGAHIALDSGAFDAAHANAAVAATTALRALVANRSGWPPDRAQGIVLVDTAEESGQLPHDIARALRDLLEDGRAGVFERVDPDDAAGARRLACCVTAIAARRVI